MYILYLRANLGLVLVVDGEVAQDHARLLLQRRFLGVASHCGDHGFNPPLCVSVCDCSLRHFASAPV
jgi:hypothetical protein